MHKQYVATLLKCALDWIQAIDRPFILLETSFLIPNHYFAGNRDLMQSLIFDAVVTHGFENATAPAPDHHNNPRGTLTKT